MSQEKLSNCCGASVVGNSDDYGICPDCKEHCEYIRICEICLSDMKDEEGEVCKSCLVDEGDVTV